MPDPASAPFPAQRVLVLGASGSIGRATVSALLARGHAVRCVLRQPSAVLPAAAVQCVADVLDAHALAAAGFGQGPVDAVVSCLASRTGEPRDAWAVDHRAHAQALRLAREHGVQRFVLLSALCVQKPRLAFQQAKRAFEEELMASDLVWSIVRPTAFFKSLSGQVARVQQGRPFLVFGDGRLTACKPISDRDLGAFVADCLSLPERARRILPIGGPGPAITPLDQAAMLSELLGRPVAIQRVPVALLKGIAGGLALLARALPPLAAKAELARIGLYYATESMLVWDAAHARYDAKATPEAGQDRLRDHCAALLNGQVTHERREHAVF